MFIVSADALFFGEQMEAASVYQLATKFASRRGKSLAG